MFRALRVAAPSVGLGIAPALRAASVLRWRPALHWSVARVAAAAPVRAFIARALWRATEPSVAAGGGGADAASPSAFPPLKVTILYGSQTGTAMAFAHDLRKAFRNVRTADGRSVAASVVDLADFAGANLTSRSGLVVLLMSCFGKGEPTDNAAAFFKWLHEPVRGTHSSVVHPLARP
jgi:sulfite reductase alpha subunit-like flavoprotein